MNWIASENPPKLFEAIEPSLPSGDGECYDCPEGFSIGFAEL
jgi:hypothetical protein